MSDNEPTLNFGFYVRRLLKMRARFGWEDSAVARFAALRFRSYVQKLHGLLDAGDKINRESLALVSEWHAKAKNAEDETVYWHGQHDGARRNALRIAAERDTALDEVQKLRAQVVQLRRTIAVISTDRANLQQDIADLRRAFDPFGLLDWAWTSRSLSHERLPGT